MESSDTNSDEINLPITTTVDGDHDNDNESTATEDILDSYSDDSSNSAFTIHIPLFYSEYDTEDKKTKPNADKISKYDWVPQPLKEHVASYCYKRNNHNNTVDNQRDMTDFTNACEKLFAKKRIFASHRQLDQVAEMFLSSWGVKKKHCGQQIRCFYSPDHNKMKRLTNNESKRRTVKQSPKEIVSCPFVINYTCINHNKSLPKLFHQVRITSCCFNHTCNPSTMSHRLAIERSGKAMPNLAGLQGVVTLLRNKPTLSSSCLRPLLKDHIPWFKPSDSKFVFNFKRKVIKFILENPSDASLTTADLLDLTSKNSAANEPTIQDSPLSRANLRDVLRAVMQEGPDIWDALALLNRYKQMNPGLDYRVRYHAISSKPEAVCWMLPEMRQDAIRYGDLLFLDAQKRDMNTPGWPYIGPCVKDNENKVRVIAECLCISESLENYVWVLKSMVEMEPQFSLQKVKLIFADQFITDNILDELNIKSTCTLHGDYYHNFNKVFPETFGNQFERIRKYLKAMLTGEESAWHSAYEEARDILIGDPDKLLSLDQIYRRAGYFSCWKLRTIEGNLFCKGSVTAEQNHASVVAHLGQGGNLSIAEHITALTQRQCHLNQLRQKKENEKRLLRAKASSARAGQMGINDVEAKKTLSSYAWTLYYKETQTELQYLVNEQGNYEFWLPTTCKERRNECHHYFIWDKENDRCTCLRRICLDIQCRHELSRDSKFDKSKWSLRWYNDETYRCHFTVAPLEHPTIQTMDVETNDYNHEENECSFNDLDGDMSEFENANTIPDSKPKARKVVSYQLLVNKMSELARLVHRDFTLSNSLQTTIQNMMDRVRVGQTIDVQFIERTSIIDSPSTQEVVGRLGVIPNARNQKRLMSRHEIAANYRRYGKRQRTSNDIDYARNNIKTKTCGFCRGSGHTANHCTKLDEYGSHQVKTLPARDELVSNLDRPDYYITKECTKFEKRPVADSLPKGSRGIVIHSKNKNTDGKIYFEATVLIDGGHKHPTYQCYPFSKGAIGRFIDKSTSRVVICELKTSNQTSTQAYNNINQMSQLSFVSGVAPICYDVNFPSVARMPTNDNALQENIFSQSSANESYIDKIGFGNGVGDL